MAKEGGRKNFWDDEEEEELSISQKRAGVTLTKGALERGLYGTEDIDKFLHEAKVLLDQTHQLYQHFFNGLEKRTPLEKIGLLEAKIAELQRTNTNITSAKFKISQFLSQYTQMKELWDRKLRERDRK